MSSTEKKAATRKDPKNIFVMRAEIKKKRGGIEKRKKKK